MLCAVCGSVGRMRGDDDRARRGASGPEPAEDDRTCEACGQSLTTGAGERVTETLAQLARFGLTGQALLNRRRVS